MRKHIVFMVIATCFVVFWNRLAFQLLTAFKPLFNYLFAHFDYYIGSAAIGRRLSEIAVLISIPLLIAGLIYVVSRLLKKSSSSSAKVGMWIIWLVLSMTFLIPRVAA